MRRRNILILGASGCIGSAIASTLRARGHLVTEGRRTTVSGTTPQLHLDFADDVAPQDWAHRLNAAGGFDVVINAVGILMPDEHNRFERIHAQGPAALFQGAALAGVQRVIQISALGVGPEAHHLQTPYALTKLQADEALLDLAHQGLLDGIVVRPSLVYGPGSQSAALFQQLARLPVVGLPGLGRQRVQPIHVLELAEAVARMAEHHSPIGSSRGSVQELAGPAVLSYREMLQQYRRAQGLGEPVWLPVPMPFMRLGAQLARHLDQQAFSPDTLTMLEHGNTSADNAAPFWLGRDPTSMAQALVLPPWVALPGWMRLGLQATLAFMWVYTAMITALWPRESHVLDLLARCGFSGEWGWRMMVLSCTLNTAMGLALLRRHPGAWTYALQAAAIVGYTATAAWNMPELTIDHCGPLVKNVPVLATVMLLWLSVPRSDRAVQDQTDHALRIDPHGHMAPLGRLNPSRA
ncbi:SDR family oxidoreductase [Aquabacterium sp.]|uniref:SDR family oxidoreductase n=1 Tax=Aquabacterium sp. TaxID=1872578 RepID=UPI003D6D7223